MKIILASFIHLFLTSVVLANGGLSPERFWEQKKKQTKTKDFYQDKIETHKESIQKQEAPKESKRKEKK